METDLRMPNILLIVADDMGWPEFEEAATPAIDGLAALGTTYRRAYSQPTCGPTRHAMMFGEYGRRLGILGSSNPWEPPSPTNPTPPHETYSIPKMLKGAGYATGLIGKWHLGSHSLADMDLGLAPYLHGFDDWFAGTPTNLQTMSSQTSGGTYFNWIRYENGAASTETQYASQVQIDRFVTWWTNHPLDPKFAVLAFNTPHSPFHNPPGSPTLSTRRAKYLQMIQDLDSRVQTAIQTVETSDTGGGEETFIVFFADNGTPGNVASPTQNPARMKNSVYEQGVNVPLIAVGPGISQGATSTSMVHVTDFLAQFASWANVPVPQGRAIDSQPFGQRSHVFCENQDANGIHKRCVVAPRYKLIDVDGQEEMYDLDNDPGELDPLDLNDPALQETLAWLRARIDP